MKKHKSLLLVAVGALVFSSTGLLMSCEQDKGVTVEDKKVLELKKEPTKTVFVVGEPFIVTGLEVGTYTQRGEEKLNERTLSQSEYTLSLAEGTILTEANSDLQVTVTANEDGYNSLVLHFQVREKTSYTVRFEYEDGTEILSTVFKEGETITYSGETPHKDTENGKYYTFVGWYLKGDASKTVVDLSKQNLAENLTFVALFSESDSEYSDGTLLYQINGTNDAYTVIGLSPNLKDASNITIPEEVEGKPVTAIRQNAFDSEELGTIKIADNVTYIGYEAFTDSDVTVVEFNKTSKLEEIAESAFDGCKSLASIGYKDENNKYLVPASLKTIGKKAFYSCKALTEINLQEGVETIYEGAFSSSNLASFYLPDSVINFPYQIGATSGGLFTSASKLTTLKIGPNRSEFPLTDILGTSSTSISTIEVDPASKTMKAEDGILYDYNQTKIFYCAPKAYGAFLEDGETLTSLTIKDSVKIIGPYAFNYAQGYKSITLGANVTEIGDYAFANCTKIATGGFIFNQKLEKIGNYSFKNMANYATSFELVTPDSLKSIGNYAFQNMYKMSSFTFGSGIQTIGEFIFDSCSGLKTINFSENSTDIVVEGDLVYNKDKTKLFFNLNLNEDITNYEMPDTLEEINGGVFSNNATLTSITFNKKLRKIGNKAFYNLKTLTGEVVLPDTLQEVGDQAFGGTNAVTKLTIPSSLTFIGESAFAGFSNADVGEITLSENLTSLGKNAFMGVKGITKAIVETDKLSVGTFSKCSGLASVVLQNEGLTELPEDVFSNCTSLTSIDGISQIKTFGKYALEGTTSLTTIDISSAVELGSDFLSGSAVTKLDVPQTVEELPERAFYEAAGLTTVKFEKVYETLPKNLFARCSNLSTVEFAGDYTSIGDYAFSETKSLTSIALPQTLKAIGSYAFDKSGLTSITIPDSVTSIGQYAFRSCTSLTSVVLSKNLNNIPNFLFDGCTSLASLDLGSVSKIGMYSFQNSGVTSLTFNSPFSFDNKNGSSSFTSMTKLESINFTKGVTSSSENVTIPSSMFEKCSSLASITGFSGVNVTGVDFAAFRDCSSLTTLPFDTTKVTSFGYYAFSGMTNLTSYEISTDSSLTEIIDNVFEKTGITSISIPENITTLGDNTFGYCSSLKEITIENPQIVIENYDDDYGMTFEGCLAVETINFNGTLEQARAVFKESVGASEYGFSSGVNIVCSDGSYTFL